MRFVLLSIALGAAAPAGERSTRPSAPQGQLQHEKSLQDHPNSASVHQAYAEYLAEHGILRAALVQGLTAQLIEPDNAAIANSLGGLYLRMGRVADSAAQFARAIGLEKGNAAYHFNLANVEYTLRHDLTTAWRMELPDLLRRALAEFREASRLSPNDFEYARAYAETFYGVPDPDWAEAEAAWKRVLALSPETDFVYLQLARVSLKQGHAENARQFLGKIVDTRHDGLIRKLLAQADRL